jgi:type IV pilus assembly protein PilQ
METPPAGPVEETKVDHEMAAFATESVEAQHPEITEAGNLTESEPTPSVESAKPVFYDESQVAAIAPTEDQTETESVDDFAVPKFEMAGDIDREIKDFLDQEPDKSFYGMLKDVKTRRRSTGPVVVTNSTIESSKLSEMRSMQEESSGEDDDVRFTKLFQETQDDLGVETLTGEEKEYKGFEISIIDVKDADVVDLLRFIADQVGLNLYVDSSVPQLSATYRFRNIPWDQALEIILANANLDKEFRNGVLRVATMDKFKDEERARQELREQREENVPRETVTFSLNYAKAEDVLPLVDNYLSKRGNILMDERTNMLIIQDIPNRMTTIRALIKKLDRMIDQVSIEARLVETSKRFLRELGIQWGLSAEYSPELGTETGLDFPNRLGVGGPNIGGISPGGLQGGYEVNLPVVSENASGIGLTLGNFLDNFKLDVSLQMLESEGFGQIISSPKITTQNNKTALIKNGQKVPIQTIQRGTITVTYIDAVLDLQVTPHITSDETVIMDVIVDKSEPDFTRTVDGNPVINIRRAETKVLVKNGGTAVIGGIFTLNEQSSEDGIPGLRKIPFLEKLFSHELKSYENQELLIFVTPRIVKY